MRHSTGSGAIRQLPHRYHGYTDENESIIKLHSLGAVRCRYNTVSFLSNPHDWHPIARPPGRSLGCLFVSVILIQYSVTINTVTYALSCCFARHSTVSGVMFTFGRSSLWLDIYFTNIHQDYLTDTRAKKWRQLKQARINDVHCYILGHT